MKKNLNIETDNILKDDKEKDTGDKAESKESIEQDDDDFGRDEDEKPLTKEELE